MKRKKGTFYINILWIQTEPAKTKAHNVVKHDILYVYIHSLSCLYGCMYTNSSLFVFRRQQQQTQEWRDFERIFFLFTSEMADREKTAPGVQQQQVVEIKSREMNNI